MPLRVRRNPRHALADNERVDVVRAFVGDSFFSNFLGDFGHVVMQDHELVRAQGECCVGASLVIAKLDFEHSGRKRFYHSPDLAPAQRALRYLFKKRNNGEWIDVIHVHSQNVTTAHPGKLFSAQDDPTAPHGCLPSGASHLKV